MKELLFLTKHLQIGGAEASLLRLLRLIDHSQYHIEVKLVFRSIQYKAYLPDNINISWIFPEMTEEAKLHVRNNPQTICNDFISHHYDAAIAFLEGYPTRILSCCNIPNLLKIAWVHTDFTNNHHSLNAYHTPEEEINAYKKFDQIMFCSHAAQAGFQQTTGLSTTANQQVYLPLPNAKELQKLSLAYETDEKSPYFCTMARLAPEKGLEKILYVANALKHDGYRFRWLILGDGPLRQQLEEQIQLQQLEDTVCLKGIYENPFPYLKNSMAYICTSNGESLGLSVAEAQLLSVPVIACDSSGIREVLGKKHGDNIVPNSADGLLNGLRAFLKKHNSFTRFSDQSTNYEDPQNS